MQLAIHRCLLADSDAMGISFVMASVRLRPRSARCYPSLDPFRWYRVVGEDASPHGYWLEDAGGDPFLTGGRRFVFRDHLEVSEG